MDLASLVLLTTVGAGYGVPVDGYPNKVERQLLLWTNAARVAPEAFEDEYQAGYEPCSYDDFLDDEKVAKPPMYVDLALTEVARAHSEDMGVNGCFQHESCDGTDTWARIAQYYTEGGALGENIAMGTSDPRYAVMGMWMCSSGHRANIMSAGFNEMGPGIYQSYQTQDFAGGTLTEGSPPVRMAVDDDAGTFLADWGDDAAPVVLQLVVEGVESDMTLRWGEPEQGIYAVEASPEGGCVGWYVYWETAAGIKGTFPEEGSWRFGDCTGYTDGVSDWSPDQAPRGGLFGDVPEDELKDAMLDDLRLVGCATAPGHPSTLLGSGALLLVAALAGRRRARPS